MPEINLMEEYPKAKRNLDRRAEIADENRVIAKLFGKEFFDGTRDQGYGGFRYDGRWKPVVRRFKEFYGLTSNDSILDVGCAKGFMLYDFRECIPGVKLRGLDISSYAIDNALDDVHELVQVGSADDLPYADASFDLVISINTIHNLPLDRCKKALTEIERVSRKHKFIVVDAYRNEEEKKRLLQWNLTAETYMSTHEWQQLFKDVGYTGDYYWFIP